ncbi:hypothetical protein JI435_036450 [Parastagonospora nodorum SN15]|uniref:Uncharacterized protein n=1 Tax=Phaeosphaeria nodorum (strain SN15 / ATCC MYA-4574 / FGSC 10173) TaxID=321614 RepID=A0A7U2EUN9_PHANO|nr:hypothetical protein JI435_036450 [Parastagonospora nodorum SN15]
MEADVTAARNRSREDAEKGAFDKEARDRSTGLFRVIAPTVSNVCVSERRKVKMFKEAWRQGRS